jgi:hypothetical protein
MKMEHQDAAFHSPNFQDIREVTNESTAEGMEKQMKIKNKLHLNKSLNILEEMFGNAMLFHAPAGDGKVNLKKKSNRSKDDI